MVPEFLYNNTANSWVVKNPDIRQNAGSNTDNDNKTLLECANFSTFLLKCIESLALIANKKRIMCILRSDPNINRTKFPISLGKPKIT